MRPDTKPLSQQSDPKLKKAFVFRQLHSSMTLWDHTNTSVNTSERVGLHGHGQGRMAAATTQLALNCPERTSSKEY